MHENYGHIGTKHMLNVVRPHYYFANMQQKIREKCSTCQICICNEKRKGRDIGLLGHLCPATQPFQIMSLDTIGGLGGKRSSKKFLHLLVDHFSRYAYISTSKNQNTEEFKRLIDTVLKENDIETLLTDQYGGLSSGEFASYLEEKNINRIFTAVDSSSSNGLNERLNQTLINRIRCRMNDGKNRFAWTTVARNCVQEYNDTIHSVTQFPPSYLMYGKEIEVLPLELRQTRDFAKDKLLAFENSLSRIMHETKHKLIKIE